MRRAQRSSLASLTVPAPMGGLNTVAPGYLLPDLDCPLLYNLIGAENGLRSRLGSREWCTGLTGLADNTVRSILAFTGSHKNGSTDKVFACTSTGIWDVTASSAAPTQLVTFGTQTGDAGYGSACVVVTAGGHFLLYCDEENGYYVWPEGGPWAKVAMGAAGNQINGVDPANFVHVMVWKNRVWFTQRDSGLAWYTAAGAIYGDLTGQSLNLGTQFSAGGDLRGLYNWTGDGLTGPDDRLVAVSGAGDVVIYGGTDPASASTFGLVGKTQVGAVPYGRRIATSHGGDVLLMSTLGIFPLSKLMRGQSIFDTGLYATEKIANLFNRLATTYRGLRAWALKIHPEDKSLIVAVPTADGQNTVQLASSLSGERGWAQYRGLPLLSMEPYGGKLYCGTADGRVILNTDYVDGVTLADPNAFTAIDCSGITRFSNGGNGRQKQIVRITPTIISEGGAIAQSVEARYRYDLTEAAPPSGVAQTAGQALWDSAVWDQSKWGGAFQTQQQSRGATGMGPDAAIAFRFAATSRTVLVGFTAEVRQGGLL